MDNTKYHRNSNDVNLPDRHWGSRPANLAYYREVATPTGYERRHEDRKKISIAHFSWTTIEERGTPDPPTIRPVKTQYSGPERVKGNLEALRKLYTNFVAKRHAYHQDEGSAIHSVTYDDDQGHLTD